jgi:ElaB/YqjD/DUF883 family membrane-anchored ribosome-binding protein
MSEQTAKLMADVKSVVSDIEAIAKTGGADAAAQISSRLGSLREKIVAAEHALVEKAKAGAKAVDGYVHENPWKSVGIAAGVGVLIGLLINRNR